MKGHWSVVIEALDVPAGSVNLIWSEGAAYILGLEESLRRWRPLLASEGLMAVTECTWLTDNPPEEAKAFWSYRSQLESKPFSQAEAIQLSSRGIRIDSRNADACLLAKVQRCLVQR